MASYYFDTSALAKHYINERGSAWVQATCDPASGHQILVSRITVVELLSALAKSQRQRIITPEQTAQLSGLVLRDMERRYEKVPLYSGVYQTAGRLVITFVSDGLRAYDAMQLASAVYANRVVQRQSQQPLIFVGSPRVP